MKKNQSFSWTRRIKSFSHAVRGLIDMVSSEHNAWFHALATILVIALACWFRITVAEFAFIVIVIVLVWIAEAFNTVLEIMADLVVGERYSRLVKRAKDIAAAAVLFAVIGAVIIGIFILGPYIIAGWPDFSRPNS